MTTIQQCDWCKADSRDPEIGRLLAYKLDPDSIQTFDDYAHLRRALHFHDQCISQMMDETARLNVVLTWLAEWVVTGEDRYNDDDGEAPRWQTRWLDVETIPDVVKTIIEPQPDLRWPPDE